MRQWALEVALAVSCGYLENGLEGQEQRPTGWAGASRPRQGGASILAMTTPGPGDQPAGRVQVCGRLDPQAVGTAPFQLRNQNPNRNNGLQRHPASLTGLVGVWLWSLGLKPPALVGQGSVLPSPGLKHSSAQVVPTAPSSGSHCFRVPRDAEWVWPAPEPAGSRDFPVARPSPT